jgi:hypothetical protein
MTDICTAAGFDQVAQRTSTSLADPLIGPDVFHEHRSQLGAVALPELKAVDATAASFE